MQGSDLLADPAALAALLATQPTNADGSIQERQTKRGRPAGVAGQATLSDMVAALIDSGSAGTQVGAQASISNYIIAMSGSIC